MTIELSAARQRLYDEAIAYAAGDINDRDRQRILCEAAKAYSRAFLEAARHPPGSEPRASSVTVPFGRDKGKTLDKVDVRGLRWLLGVVSESVDDESKARWREQNVALRDAIEAELEGR